jgi:hypothetical protein
VKNWLVLFVNTQSGWLVSQMHVIAEDAETAVKTAAEKFGIDLAHEDAVTAHVQDWTSVAGPVDTEAPATVQAEPEVFPPMLNQDKVLPPTLPEILEHDAELLADDVEKNITANPAASEVAAVLRDLSPEALALLKELVK